MDYLYAALKHLRKDRLMRGIIDQVGDFKPRPAPAREHFRILTYSIVGQMLSLKAADTIRQRLIAKIKPRKISPETLRQLTIAQLRAVGLSNTKARAMHDLSERAAQGVLPINGFSSMEDQDIIDHLTEVHGVGRWTAEMFLMFGLVRPDIWPIDDLGIRAAVKKMDRLAEMPLKPYMLKRGEPFAPYRTVASWYLWQSLTLK